MSVLRTLNILGGMRVDVPHLRSLESSIAADFDVVAGRVQSGEKAVVIRGFTLSNFTAGMSASSVQLDTANGIVYNINASEAGTFLWVPADRELETLDSATNPRVGGGFAANQYNYIGLDFKRAPDTTTTDLAQFLDSYTLLEAPRSVPLGRTLDYRIVISTVPFSATPNIIPIAVIKTDPSNNIDTPIGSVQDVRNILWRLGSGGEFPNRYDSFSWGQSRNESVTGTSIFTGGDKNIESQKDWMDAVMSRLWELGGGEYWYSPTADRNVRMVRAPGSVFASTGDNFEWVSGLYTVNHLHWQGLRIVFDNSNTIGAYYNIVTDQLGDDSAGSAAASKTALADGDCIYVDIDRRSNTSTTAKKSSLQALSTPTTPGSRFVIAWRSGNFIYTRDAAWPVNSVQMQAATTTVIGGVRLNNTPAIPGTPTVATLNANNSIVIGTVAYPIAGANPAIVGTGTVGVRGVGGINHTDTGVEGYGQIAIIGYGRVPSNFSVSDNGGNGGEFRGGAGSNFTPSISRDGGVGLSIFGGAGSITNNGGGGGFGLGGTGGAGGNALISGGNGGPGGVGILIAGGVGGDALTTGTPGDGGMGAMIVGGNSGIDGSSAYGIGGDGLTLMGGGGLTPGKGLVATGGGVLGATPSPGGTGVKGTGGTGIGAPGGTGGDFEGGVGVGGSYGVKGLGGGVSGGGGLFTGAGGSSGGTGAVGNGGNGTAFGGTGGYFSGGTGPTGGVGVYGSGGGDVGIGVIGDTEVTDSISIWGKGKGTSLGIQIGGTIADVAGGKWSGGVFTAKNQTGDGGYALIVGGDASGSPYRAALRIVPQVAAPTVPVAGDLYVKNTGLGAGKLHSPTSGVWRPVGGHSRCMAAGTITLNGTATPACAGENVTSGSCNIIGDTINVTYTESILTATCIQLTLGDEMGITLFHPRVFSQSATGFVFRIRGHVTGMPIDPATTGSGLVIHWTAFTS